MEQSIKAVKGLGAGIRAARRQKRYTQEDMAAKLQVLGCDISRGTYAKIESGIRHVSLLELRAIARILDADFNSLLDF